MTVLEAIERYRRRRSIERLKCELSHPANRDRLLREARELVDRALTDTPPDPNWYRIEEDPHA